MIVVARAGDCLCTIAISGGFVDCQPLRDDPANASLLTRPLRPGDIVTVPEVERGQSSGATEQKHRFKRKAAPPVRIRFVHGSPNIPYLQDDTISVLHISNHRTTRGGAEDETTLPAGFGFAQPGHDDPDTLKVEIVDPAAQSPVNVRLEALRRTVTPTGTFDHVPFTGAELVRRSLDPLECEVVSSKVAFRSRYLRLVTDDTDQAALPNQTLLVTDMTDEGDATVEILEQAVRATYVLQRCPGGANACQVSVVAPVGSTTDTRKPRKHIRMAVHVLTTAPGAAPVATIANVDRRIHRWVRRTYAQAGMAPLLVQATRIVDPQNNLVAIGEPGGLTATGGHPVGFRITSPGQPTQVIGPITTGAGNAPVVTAGALAALVRAPYTASVTRNPPGFTGPPGNRSADIVITIPDGLVTVDQELTSDPRQPLVVGRPNPLNLEGFGADFLIGSVQQRALLKTYDTGEDRVDVVVVQDMANGTARGQAMMHGPSLAPGREAIEPVRFSVFVNAVSMDASDDDFVNLQHEMGHILTDLIHATGIRSAQQLLMGQGTTFLVSEDASKRIKERPQLFDSPAGSHSQIRRIHQQAARLLASF